MLCGVGNLKRYMSDVSYCCLEVSLHLSQYIFCISSVFFDMDVGGEDAGRITFELRADVAPKT